MVSALVVGFLVAAVPCAPAAFAQMYKCAGEGGTPVYQDAPCPPGRELRNFAADPANVSILPMRPPPGASSRIASPPRERPVKATKADARKNATAGDPAERRHVQLGMHEGEVLARLGAPDMRSGGSGALSHRHGPRASGAGIGDASIYGAAFRAPAADRVCRVAFRGSNAV